MRKPTKPYITKLDRTWKDKEWFTSYRSYKNIRCLTEEEAKPFLEDGTIEEVILPEYGKDIMGDIMEGGKRTGRVFCKKCGSEKGFYIKKCPFGKRINVYTCADCGIREVRKWN